MPIFLSKEYIQENAHQSSKGNQLKWLKDGIWYKADYTGYEGLSEYVVSELLKKSTLKPAEFIEYQPEQIIYRGKTMTGCRSRDFLRPGWRIITLERLFQNAYGVSLYASIYRFPDAKARLEFLENQVKQLTGLRDFGAYLAKLLAVDAFFLNEDRHMHNIAVLERGQGIYDYCPIFDNGAGLLSDTTLDYPMEGDIYALMDEVSSKTVSTHFEEQLEAAEELFGCQLHFRFTKRDVREVLAGADAYPKEVTERVETILREQMRKYQYLF